MARKKQLTPKLKKQIAELVASGLDVKQALDKLNNPVSAQTVYKEQPVDPEFASMMQDAYYAHMMSITSELSELAYTTASEAFPGLEFREAEAALKRRVQILQHKLDKLGPLLTKRLDKTHKVEHTGLPEDNKMVIVLSNFHAQPVNVIDNTPLLPKD